MLLAARDAGALACTSGRAASRPVQAPRARPHAARRTAAHRTVARASLDTEQALQARALPAALLRWNCGASAVELSRHFLERALHASR
jgi:hypothetical protein